MKKIKRNKRNIILTLALSAMYLFVGLVLWNRLPLEITTNFAFDGSSNSISSKPFAVLFPGCTLLVMQLLIAFGMGFDPQEKGISDKIYCLCLWIVPIISLFTSFIIYGSALGMHMNIQFLVFFFAGCIFIAVGNYIPKVKKNYFVGFRVPWTLNSAENWNRTNRMSGWIMFLSGCIFVLLSVVALFVLYTEFVVMGLFVTVLAINLLIPLIYSLNYYMNYESKDNNQDKDN